MALPKIVQDVEDLKSGDQKAGLAAKTVADKDGKDITATYLKKEELDLGEWSAK